MKDWYTVIKQLSFVKNWHLLKGGGHGKIYSEFIVYIFSLGSIKTYDTIFKIFRIR